MTEKSYFIPTKTVTKEVWQKPQLDIVAPHFNGQRFFNPWEREERNQAALFKWILTRQSQTWPRWCQNQQFSLPPARYSESLNAWKVWFVGHATLLLQIGPYNFLIPFGASVAARLKMLAQNVCVPQVLL